jgi:hypothetical protein
MSRVEEIQQAIGKLTLEERAELLSSLMNFEDDEWDKQMKRDAAAGKFDRMNREAEEEFKAGKTIPLDKVIEES